MVYTHCVLCGHLLENVESQERGYGPHCWQKIKAQTKGYIPTPEQLRQIRINELLEKNNVQFCCEQCGEPTPVDDFKRGKCSRCRREPVKLEDLDMIPFAEGP